MAVQKKYVCAFCARAFTRLEHKQRHERSHTNEKPFHCMYCTSAFVRRDLLQRHCRTVHSINLSSSAESKPAAKETTIAKKEVEFTDLDKTEVKEPPEYVPKPRANSIANISLTKTDSEDTNDLINLLSISKKLYQTLSTFDYEITKFSEDEINDIFLIGYTELNSYNDFPIFKDILKKVLHYLNTNFQDVNNFKIVIIYNILSIGYHIKLNHQLSVLFFNKNWNLLTLKLIPINYTNNNLMSQLEILNNLFLLSYTYLKFNLNNLIVLQNQQQPVSPDPNKSQTSNISSDLIFNYLNDISAIILNNIVQGKDSTMLLNNNMSLFWSVYVLLSNYFINSYPPKFYNVFLTQPLIDGQCLKDTMLNFSKSIVMIDTVLFKEIIISTLINELNYQINYNKLLIYDLKNTLHNSIILINKSIINLNSDDSNSIFEIFKKKLIINCPIKFNDLLNQYIFQPVENYQINLLFISLKEFNFNYNYNYNYSFNFNMFIQNNMKTDLFKFSNNLMPFFNKSIIEINNNLGIVSFPIIFNANFLATDLNLLDRLKQLPSFNKLNLSYLIIEWYLTIFKIIINLYKNEELINNYILQCLLYMLNNNSSDFKLHDSSWFLNIFGKLDVIFSQWLALCSSSNEFGGFRLNLNEFITNFINSSIMEGDSNKYMKKLSVSSNSSNTSYSTNMESGGSNPNSNPSSAALVHASNYTIQPITSQNFQVQSLPLPQPQSQPQMLYQSPLMTKSPQSVAQATFNNLSAANGLSALSSAASAALPKALLLPTPTDTRSVDKELMLPPITSMKNGQTVPNS